MPPIIDCHTHCFPDKVAARALELLVATYHVPTYSDATIADTRRVMGEDGVDIALVLPVAVRPEQVVGINNWAATLASDTIVPLGSMHPGLDDPAAEIDRLVEMGFRGIKLHPTFGRFYPDDPAMDPIYKACAGRLVVYFHAGDEIEPATLVWARPERIARALDRHPGLTAVAAHFGGYLDWGEAEEHLLGRPNLYLDTSYCPERVFADEMVRRFIDRQGANRVLFGSDLPWARPGPDLARWRRLLTPQEQELILWRNAAELFGIKFGS